MRNRFLAPILSLLLAMASSQAVSATPAGKGVPDDVAHSGVVDEPDRSSTRHARKPTTRVKGEAAFRAGWTALNDLDRPDQARSHFLALLEGASDPATRVKAAYWLGRAYERLGDPHTAARWYQAAALHGHTFYGQAAAARLRIRPVVASHPEASFTKGEFLAIAATEQGRRAVEAAAADRTRERDAALMALARNPGTPKSMAIAATLARMLGATPTAVSIARMAEAKGIPLIEAGYPTPPLAWHDPRTPKELVLAVIREESGFRQTAKSPKHAVGLMQVTKGAADHSGMIAGAKVEFPLVSADARYNVAVGSHYLGMMLDRYGGAPILALAAYNAGPGRADSWIERHGDPRKDVDPIDWIESIPFDETRAYVKRVMSSYITYLAMAERTS